MVERPLTDPTHGRIDLDIQQAVDEMRPKTLAQRVAMENTLQARRDDGLVVLGQPPIPEHIYKVWGNMAVLCPDHDSPTWHHRCYHEQPRPHPWRVRLRLVRESLRRDLSYLLRGR